MARAQSENYGEIRREILRKTAALFASQGYPNSSIAEIARANGISRGLLYHYFTSKEALLVEMLNDHLDALLDDLTGAAKTGSDAEARFRETVRAMVNSNALSKDLQVVLLHDLHNLAEDDRSGIVLKQKQILSLFTGLIKDCDKAGAISARTLTARTMMFIGMLNYTYIWYDPDGAVGPEEYAQMVSDTFLAGLRAV